MDSGRIGPWQPPAPGPGDGAAAAAAAAAEHEKMRYGPMIPMILNQLRGLILHRAASSAGIRQQKPVVLCELSSTGRRFAVSTKSPTMDLDAVRKQVEYYFSDQNLRSDVYLYKKLSEAQDGWFPISELLKFNKIRALKVSASEIIDAVRDSPFLKTRQVQKLSSRNLTRLRTLFSCHFVSRRIQDGALCRAQPQLPPLDTTAAAAYSAAAELTGGVPCKYFAAAGFCSNVSIMYFPPCICSYIMPNLNDSSFSLWFSPSFPSSIKLSLVFI